MSKERRDRLQIYYDILSSMELEVVNTGSVKPTRIQHLSNLSYDKLRKHLLQLDKNGLISLKDGNIEITDKGREFLGSFNKVVCLVQTMGLEF